VTRSSSALRTGTASSEIDGTSAVDFYTKHKVVDYDVAPSVQYFDVDIDVTEMLSQ